MFGKIEKVVKLISLCAIPVALWWMGTRYQTADTKARTAVEYVRMSIEIINNQDEADPQLLEWATRTFNHYAEIDPGASLVKALASGEANVLPSTAVSG